ncbi:hypothetical protein CsSME_00048854 [Camellia sinensis var. sinensis]
MFQKMLLWVSLFLINSLFCIKMVRVCFDVMKIGVSIG